MDETRTHMEIVKVVVQSTEPVLHHTASNQARREWALTILNRACSTEELEGLAALAERADVSAVVQDAARRWGSGTLSEGSGDGGA